MIKTNKFISNRRFVTTRKKFKLLMDIRAIAPWLPTQKVENFAQLLERECSMPAEEQLIKDLLKDFLHISHKNYIDSLTLLAKDIVRNHDEERTQIIATASDRSSDSSQYILYDLRVIFAELGWYRYKEVNRHDHSIKTFKEHRNYNNLILVDEFIGSGKTIIGRVSNLHTHYKENNKVEDYSISVSVIAACNLGLENVHAAGIEAKSIYCLRRGISEKYGADEVADKISMMQNLESKLKEEFNEYKIVDHALGYGGCESLYYRELGNLPNSVFPFFWWPEDIYNAQRKPPFTRSMIR